MWAYPLLSQFKQARIGSRIITFDDLKREMNLEYNGEEHHCWLITKDKQNYLLLAEHISNLPVKIKETKMITDKSNIYHFITKFSPVGFGAEKHYSFKRLTQSFFDVKHSNPPHFTLLRIFALAAYISRLNMRVCSNPEFGKDSTFEVLNYLTNHVSVFDKPRTMAKLEYGVVNRVLMVNELVPKSNEEKHNINEFLLSIGSLKPIYQKTSRGSSAHSTRDSYDITDLSLVISYNSISDVSEKDKEDYFDYVFGKNILERFMPFKFQGRLDIEQFVGQEDKQLSLEEDQELLKIARTIEWYRRNWTSEVKDFKVNLHSIKLSGRQKHTFYLLVKFIGLYAESQQEFEEYTNALIEAHQDYNRMIAGNNTLSAFSGGVEYPADLPENPMIEIEDIAKQEQNEKQTPLEFMQDRKSCDIEEFLSMYSEEALDKLKQDGDVCMCTPHEIMVLE